MQNPDGDLVTCLHVLLVELLAWTEERPRNLGGHRGGGRGGRGRGRGEGEMEGKEGGEERGSERRTEREMEWKEGGAEEGGEGEEGGRRWEERLERCTRILDL